MKRLDPLFDATTGRPYCMLIEGIPRDSVAKVWDVIRKASWGRVSGLRIPIRFIAEMTELSRWTVMRVLEKLEIAGVIRRAWAPLQTSLGYLCCQTIDILVRALPSKSPESKPKHGEEKRSKKFAPTGSNIATSPVAELLLPSSYEELDKEKQQAAVVGEGPDGPPPPSSEEEDLPPAPQELPGLIAQARCPTPHGRLIRGLLRGYVHRGQLPAGVIPDDLLVDAPPADPPRQKPTEAPTRPVEASQPVQARKVDLAAQAARQRELLAQIEALKASREPPPSASVEAAAEPAPEPPARPAWSFLSWFQRRRE